MLARLFLMSFLLTYSVSVMAQKKIPLWPDKIPNRVDSDEKEEFTNEDILWITKIQKPEIEVFLPPNRKNSGTAVLIMPGGGYAGLAYDWEGTDVAKYFNSIGVAAFVLKYRVPLSKSVENKEWVPLQDAQRAIRIIRAQAAEFKVDKNSIGVMGFSAGGHLASTLGTHYNNQLPFMDDAVEKESARPDFLMLMYPVISMKSSLTHQGSHDNLIGKAADKQLRDMFSNELHVNAQTPPTFLLHATDDGAVKVENSLVFYQALKDNGVPVEMHIFPAGGHGFGLGTGNPSLAQWPSLLAEWINGLKN
ncbi:alpha/beta hydrolase [Roseivirga pacifica]|uniref:alpha/beta hydrolase n=1 Tax=Roseivirga pacifica TaxID=1267423 RepID=UPI00227B4AF8|nr:alpha/beta hydrolase [Roseivirga pacifica]